MIIEFQPWRPFHARRNKEKIREWLKEIGDESEKAFKSGASRQWPGRPHRGSRAGQWPMKRSGHLIDTIQSRVKGESSVTIGSNARRGHFSYSAWLQKTGRKMSKEALQEGMRKAGRLTRWVEWTRL